MKILWVGLVLLSACGTNGSGNDGGADGTVEGSACPSPVIAGDTCLSEGTMTCGIPPLCTDVSTTGTVSCACTNGRWDCGECPACADASTACGLGEVCSGSVAQLQCDGTTEYGDAGCTCGGNSWVCKGITPIACDGGVEASTNDASSDASSE